jgi:phospholipid/cholesterol/gamma-HCH transport system substrate-binding protein
VITRATVLRVVAFGVLTVALVLYIGAHFLGLFTFLGPRDYTVRVPLSDASGLFERGEVSFRGVKVGAIGPLNLTDRGVLAELVLTGGGPKIPADLNVVIADRSAVGERYVDLRPNTDSGPYLHDGSVIPADRVSLPPPVATVLQSLDQLVASVPRADLRLAVDQLGVAFDGLGPKLQLLLDSTHSLTATATDYLPQTLSLIHDAHTVLDTQNNLADPIKSFSADLKRVGAQLKDSDPDIRRLTRTGPDAARELDKLLDESGEGLHRTIKEGRTLSEITTGRLRDLQGILQLYPGLAAAVPTIIPGDGTAHLGLALNLNDPPPCSNGYGATKQRAGTDTGPSPINYRAFCREPLFSVIDVRGVKPGYPFVNNHPTRPPDWYHAFYQRGGRAAGIFGPPLRGDGNAWHGAPQSGPPVPAVALPGLFGSNPSAGAGALPTAPGN